MKGEVLLEALEVKCIIGILSHERATPQRLLLDVVMNTDFSKAATSDEVVDAVNNAEVADQLKTLAVEHQFWLVEKLVTEACRLILDQHPAVDQVTVTARKPDIMAGSLVVGARLTMNRA